MATRQTQITRQTQLAIEFPKAPNKLGGRRAGAGRKRTLPRSRVPHRRRPKLASRFPVHVTVRMRDGLPRLRGFQQARVLRRAFVHGCDRNGFRICQFSIQGNHVHLVCEAKNREVLSRGVQGWKIRVTKALNRHWRRRGTVWDGRYHLDIMRTPRHTRAVLCYVIQNARRHGQRLPRRAHGIDPYSSAWYFDGWRDERWRRGLAPPPDDPDHPGPPVAPARTWLLNVGWRRHGLLAVDEVPAAGRRGAVKTRRRR